MPPLELKLKKPCNDCPYRKDAPLQKWAKEEFADLAKNEKQAREQFAKELQLAFQASLWYGVAEFNGGRITEYQIREIARNSNIDLVYYCPA